jgi:PAS domain S-box-containing protein
MSGVRGARPCRHLMSTSATHINSTGGALEMSEGGPLDLTRYCLQQVQGDAEFALFRGRQGGPEVATGPSILVRTPAADHPSPACLKKMQNEHALRSELDPAHVVRSISLGSADGRPVLILEDPGATPLDVFLKGAMETALFLRLAVSVAAALGHVHSRGLVHKDIKPANILVNIARDHAWLTGMGLASRLPRERQAPHPPELALGTLVYMAPEQTGCMNRPIDSRSDLYALGVTFYEMLTGIVPFTASDPLELVHCHVARKPTPPCERLESVPRALSAIVMKLLAKTAEGRYQTAAGVQRDLQRCLTQWEAQHGIEEFPVGEEDTPDRLLIPQKLYGREAEINALLAAFQRVVAGNGPELAVVCGYSGIGKSSVVNELHQALVPPRGLFASGKFDQYQRDIPYATLAQAFQSLIRTLLGSSEAELSPWRSALQDALGPNGKLMVNLVPELQLIIGEPPPVLDIPLQDAQRRFQLVLRRFIGVFARPEQPLVLFLDDLQWLDSATLDLLEDLLTQSDLRHLLLIGAYRNNEVNASHPLLRKLDVIQKAGGRVLSLVLAPLSPSDLASLIADLLRCEREPAAALAALLHAKTGGNPFFAIQFLTALVEEGLLTFDYAAARWAWDLDSIRAKGYTDNVVDLMVGKLSRLPVATQQVLQLLACMGDGADCALLETVCQRSGAQLQRQLWDAIRADLICHSEQSYRFLHDRVQEAAYSLIPEQARAETHLRIGRLLAARIAPERPEATLFEIVNQLNLGSHLVTSTEERKRYSALNLSAGKRAKGSTAYTSALSYLGAARALLTEENWDEDYELLFAVECEIAQCELLTADMESAERRLLMLAKRARSLHDISVITRLRLTLCTASDRSDHGVAICLEYLQRHYGENWPAHPTSDDVQRAYDRIWALLGARQIEELLDLPLIDDPDTRDVLDVLGEMVSPALFLDFELCALVLCRMVALSLEHGNSDASCYAYVYFGRIAGVRFGHYRDGFRFGQLGFDLVERRGLQRYQARTLLAFATQVMPTVQHARKCRELLRTALHSATEMGDLTHAAYSADQLVWTALTTADPLDEVQWEAAKGLELARRTRFGLVADYFRLKLQLIRTLRGLTAAFGSFNDAEFDEATFERHLASNPALFDVSLGYWALKVQAWFFAGDYAAAIEAAARARHWTGIKVLVFEQAWFEFYSGLCHAASWDRASLEARPGHLEALTGHHRQLEILAHYCPENFASRALLLGAEIARLEHREPDAERLYEQAINSARAHGLVHVEAIAYEFAAKFQASRGFQRFADLYLCEARYCYQRWGADAKVAQLEHLYPHLVRGRSISTPTDRIGTPVEQLDLATVIKVSQAVSGEMVMEKLIDTLMRTAIEHAGAERGLLILSSDSVQRVVAEATTRGETVIVRAYEESASSAVLPESILHRVIRTQGSVILDDASARNPFSADPYIGPNRIRSVLCLPLTNRGKLIGVLYLENNLAPGVFAPARVAVLKLIASQAAISLENTRLYRDLAEREVKIRGLVEANIVGIEIVDLDGRILEANDAFLRMLDYEREDLASGRLRWTDLTPSKWRDRDRQDVVAELQRSGRLQPFEWEYIRKDGSRVPVLSGAATFEGGNRAVGFVIDLTELKRAEQALRQSEGYLAEAQRLTHTGSWAYHHLLGKFTYYSDEQFRIHGLDPRRGRPPDLAEILALFHPEDRDRMLATVERIIREKCEYILDYRIKLPDGAVRYLHSTGHPLLDEAGELLAHFGSAIDVTERERVEQRLRAQHHVTRILAEAATMEEATTKILGALCECLGCHLGALWRLDREADVLRCAAIWRAISVEAAQYEAATRASVLRRGRGLPGKVWMSRVAACVPDVACDPEFERADVAAREDLHAAFALPILLNGEVLGVIELISRDVWQPEPDLLFLMTTIGSQIGQFMERKRAENALQVAQSELAHVTRLMTMGELTASIAHEVNQPLGAMVTSAGSCALWLAAQPPDIENAQRALERIIKDGRRAGEVIKRIRALMTRQAPRKSSLDINDVILEVIALAQYELRCNDVLLETRLSEGLPPVQGDRVQLQQVLLNLIVNAIEAMSGIDDRRHELTIVSSPEGPDTIRVDVRDSGMGLYPDNTTHLFDPFYTTKAQGIGIGLSISRSIIEAHGGQLSAGPNSPYGAVFRFSLPVNEDSGRAS